VNPGDAGERTDIPSVAVCQFLKMEDLAMAKFKIHRKGLDSNECG